MTEYVAGFLFDDTMRHVALVLKRKPKWQEGKWNAIGGKVEPGETPYNAMRREFAEETSVSFDHWKRYCTLSGDGFVVHFYYGASLLDLFSVKTVEEEQVYVYQVKYLPGNIMTNVRWLIEMAMSMSKERAASFAINEEYAS